MAVAGASEAYYFPVLGEQVETITALIAAGHPLDGRVDGGRYGYTPLALAAAEQKQRSVEALIEGGADVNAAGASGFTPLSMAIRGGGGSPRDKEQTAIAVRYLIEHGALPTAKDVELVEGLMDSSLNPIFSDELKQFVREAYDREAQHDQASTETGER